MYILINNLLLLNHQNVHFDPDLLIYWHCTATGNWKNSSEPKFRAKKKEKSMKLRNISLLLLFSWTFWGSIFAILSPFILRLTV